MPVIKREDRAPIREEDVQGLKYFRVRDNSCYDLDQERPLSETARAAGVLQDAQMTLGASSKSLKRPNHPIRLVLRKTKGKQR